MSYVRLDDAFLRFVNLYIKAPRFKKPPDIFQAIEKIQSDLNGVCPEVTKYGDTGRIYWNDKDYIRCDRKVVLTEDVRILDNLIILTERTMNAVNEFRRFLTEHPLQIVYSKERGDETQIMSNRLFATADSFEEVLKNGFFSYEGHDLYVDGDGFEAAMKVLRVGEGTDQGAKEEAILKKDKTAYCMYRLFGKLEYRGILEKFLDDRLYAEEGEVDRYLQSTYDVSASLVVRTLLPILKGLKSEL